MEDVKGPDINCETDFNRLVNDYGASLLRMACMYLKDKALAEDAVQETFLKAYKAQGSFRGDCAEKTWLMRIALNTCHDIRRSGWFKHIDRNITPEFLPEAQTTLPEQSQEIVTEIMKLPPKLKEVVLLYYYQNMTVLEIADALNIGHSTVSNRLKRAKAKLYDAMKGEYFNG